MFGPTQLPSAVHVVFSRNGDSGAQTAPTLTGLVQRPVDASHVGVWHGWTLVVKLHDVVALGSTRQSLKTRGSGAEPVAVKLGELNTGRCTNLTIRLAAVDSAAGCAERAKRVFCTSICQTSGKNKS
jgi:hypothetical protein